MAKNAITDYSTTAASNTDCGGVDSQGTAPASNMDDLIRELMSHLAETNAGTSPWADTMTIGDAADLTKKLRFELSGFTTATTRVLTPPNYDGTIATLAGTETLTNKTLVAPALGTPASGVMTNVTGLPLTTGTTGVLAETKGGTNQSTYTQGDLLYASAANTLSKLAKGTAGQTLRMNSGATIPEWTSSGLLTSGTAQASTSGTSIDFTSIPSWVKRITVLFSGVSTSGNDGLLVQIGDSGGIEATGYLGASGLVANADTTSTAAFTTGFGIHNNNAAAVIHGSVVLNLLDAAAFTWAASVMIGWSNSATLANGGGSKSLSATLDRVRITTVGGTDTFDAGKINILYE